MSRASHAHGASGSPLVSAAHQLHVLHCFDAIVESILDQTLQPAVKHTWTNDKYPLFVTWKKRGSNGSEWRLRGCIGTFSAKELNAGLREYAVIAALHDSRFSPISAAELAHLKCDISLLTRFEHVTGATARANGTHSRAPIGVHDWIIGVHGITIDFTCPSTARRYNATFLPQVAHEQGWTHAQTLTELVHKSGYRGTVDAALQQRIALTRYQSDCASLTWQEYADMRQALTGSPVPSLKQIAAAATASSKHAAAARGTYDDEDEDD